MKKKHALGFLSCAELHRLTEEHREQMDEGKSGQSGEEVKATGSTVVCVCLCESVCLQLHVCVSRNANNS